MAFDHRNVDRHNSRSNDSVLNGGDVMSITDGTVWCDWCGMDRTSCNLCGGLSVLKGPDTYEENRKREKLRNERSELVEGLRRVTEHMRTNEESK